MVQVICRLLASDGKVVSKFASREVEAPEGIECLFPKGGWLCGSHAGGEAHNYFALGAFATSSVFGEDVSAARTIRVELMSPQATRTWELQLKRLDHPMSRALSVRFSDSEVFSAVCLSQRNVPGSSMNRILDPSDSRFPLTLFFREFPAFYGEGGRATNSDHGQEMRANVSRFAKIPSQIMRHSRPELSHLTLAIHEKTLQDFGLN